MTSSHRLIADLQEPAAETAGVVTPAGLEAEGAGPREADERVWEKPRQWRRITALVATASLVALMVYWRPSRADPPVAGIAPITDSASMKYAPIVTDGSRLYYTEVQDGQYCIAQVSTGGGESSRIPVPFPNPHLSEILPDGSALLVRSFPRFRQEDGPLWIVPLAGGAPRRLGNLAGYDGSWSADGRQFVYTAGNEIFLAQPDGSAPRKLAAASGQAWWPRWSHRRDQRPLHGV